MTISFVVMDVFHDELCKNFDYRFSRFDTMPEHNRRMDGYTLYIHLVTCTIRCAQSIALRNVR